MRTVNIHEAKTQLSRLVDRAARGEPFIIAKAGRPLVKVVPSTHRPRARLGGLVFLPDRSRFRTISTVWARPRSQRRLAAAGEIAARYPRLAVGGRPA